LAYALLLLLIVIIQKDEKDIWQSSQPSNICLMVFLRLYYYFLPFEPSDKTAKNRQRVSEKASQIIWR